MKKKRKKEKKTPLTQRRRIPRKKTQRKKTKRKGIRRKSIREERNQRIAVKREAPPTLMKIFKQEWDVSIL